MDIRTKLRVQRVKLRYGNTVKKSIINQGGGNPDWADVQNKPSTFTPASHNHDLLYEPINSNIQSHLASAHAPSNAQKNSDITKAEIEAKLTGELSSHTHAGGGGQAFPVGSIFVATVNTNPATLLGYGVWIAFGSGRVMVGHDTLDPDFDTAEETGGAKTVALTTAQLPAHNHQILRERSATTGAATTQIARTADASSTIDTGVFTENAGSGQAHNNLQPYIVVYMWKRTL